MKKFGKRDLFLILALLCVCAVFLLIYRLFWQEDGAYAVVTVDGTVYGKYSLNEQQEIPIEIQGERVNLLAIREGEADMIWADCPDRLCVHQRAISKTNENIVCLPNKVVVTIEADKEGDFDSIAR